MLEPADGTFFPPGCQCCSVGPRQRTRGSSPEALQERGNSCRGFLASFCQCAGHLFQSASAMFQPASVAHA
jgi:hypothetical protein